MICTASFEKGSPPFLTGSGKGWLTAEYAMLPGSTSSRKKRDGARRDSRGVEISRLIGRSLRQAIDLYAIGENTITIDCDVLQADGGTRTASISGGFVALCLCVSRMMEEGIISASPILRQVAAISCGIVDGKIALDLDYFLDSNAYTDANIVGDNLGNIIEVQATGEREPFSRKELTMLLDAAEFGIRVVQSRQQLALKDKLAQLNIKPSIVIASSNANKKRELKNILGKNYNIISPDEIGFNKEIVEDGSTFSENAVIKAETLCRKTGYPSIGDDSGLMVHALNGAPGVYSARYAGDMHDDEKNNIKLLQDMQGIEDRRAKFVCAAALSYPQEETKVFTGEVFGEIGLSPAGDNGFGYDPLFVLPSGKTMAQISSSDKNAISHRAIAMKKLEESLKGE